MIKAYVVGIFPRSKRLISTWKALDRGEVDREYFREVYIEEMGKVVNIYKVNKLDHIHDPQSNWNDIFRPFTLFEGIDPGPLTRFFENNTFYKKPIVKDEPRFDGDALENYILITKFRDIDSISIPGPITFLTLSNIRVSSPIQTIAKLISETISFLFEKGYRRIFLHEPSIPYLNISTENIEKTYRYLLEFRDILVIYMYFSKSPPSIIWFIDNGFTISFDMNWNRLDDLPKLDRYVLGYVDGQNTLLEDPLSIRRALKRVIDGGIIEVCNNVDLDFLPYEYALKKVEILGRIRRD